MREIVLERVENGQWEERENNRKSPALVHRMHLNHIEMLMRERYERTESRVYGLPPDETIKRIVIRDDGTMDLYLVDKEI